MSKHIEARLQRIERILQNLAPVEQPRDPNEPYKDNHVFVCYEHEKFVVRTRKGEKRNYQIAVCDTVQQANYIAIRYSKSCEM